MNSTFCSDLVSLFVNHLFDCNDCFVKVLFVLLVLFFGIGLILFLFFILTDFVSSLIISLFERISVSSKYKELEAEFEHLNDSYSELLVDYNSLGLKYADLEKEYYHTCN